MFEAKMKYIITAHYKDDGAPEKYFRDTLAECQELEKELLQDEEIEAVYISDEPQKVEMMV
jgi:hypothetical protein